MKDGRMARFVLCFFLFSACSAFPQSGARLFDYNAVVPFNIKEISVIDKDGIAIHDIRYDAQDRNYPAGANGLISAYRLVPPGGGPFAGIVFVHWLGSTNANRDEFLKEASALAKKGAECLLVQGYFPWSASPKDSEYDRRQVIHQTIEFRRALDLLLSQPEVDQKRIAYVGHDYGALYGGVLSGVEKRVKAFVLTAGMGDFSTWFLKFWLGGMQEKDRETYTLAMSSVDPIGYVSNASPAALFFQFATIDRFILKDTALKFYQAASEPKSVAWYDTTHSFDYAQATVDRDRWLENQLELKGGGG